MLFCFQVKEKLKNFRIKDVNNYVFSASCLGLLPKDDVCKIIINFLDQIFNTKEKCKKRSKVLVGMCLSMWMLDYKPKKLIKIIFSEMSIADLRSKFLFMYSILVIQFVYYFIFLLCI